MPEKNGDGSIRVWQWISASLLALLMFSAGGNAGGFMGSHSMAKHAEQAGHPVMVSRVNGIEKSLNERLNRIEAKVDRLLEVRP